MFIYNIKINLKEQLYREKEKEKSQMLEMEILEIQISEFKIQMQNKSAEFHELKLSFHDEKSELIEKYRLKLQKLSDDLIEAHVSILIFRITNLKNNPKIKDKSKLI